MKIKIAEYDKDILKVFSGTFMAQAITFLVTPLIAKQFGPAEYGIYAGVLAAISILSVLSTGKYELAIMLPDDDLEVKDLMGLSNWINLIVCLLIVIFIFLCPVKSLNSLLGLKNGTKLLFLAIPICSYLLATFQIFNYWLIRKRNYSTLSINKILRSVLFGLLAISLAYISRTALFLVIALTLSHFFSNVFLRLKVKELNFKPSILLSSEKRSVFLDISKKYSKFPKFILPAELMNVVCAQMPVFVFLWVFSSKDSGYFSFILALLNMPISLFAGAILDVFKEKASKDYRETGSCREIYVNTLKKMVLMSIVPFVLLLIFGEKIIILIFGDQWSASGKFLNILLFMFLLKFISSPLSFIFYIVHKQKEDFLWHIYILLSTAAVLYIGAMLFNDILITVKLYSINFSIVYIIYLIRSYQLSNQKIII